MYCRAIEITLSIDGELKQAYGRWEHRAYKAFNESLKALTDHGISNEAEAI